MSTVHRIFKLERCVPYQLLEYRPLLEWLVFKGRGVTTSTAGIFVALPDQRSTYTIFRERGFGHNDVPAREKGESRPPGL